MTKIDRFLVVGTRGCSYTRLFRATGTKRCGRRWRRRGAASTTRSEKHARTLVYSPSRPLSSPFEEGRETQHTARWCVQREIERVGISIREFYRNERARILENKQNIGEWPTIIIDRA